MSLTPIQILCQYVTYWNVKSPFPLVSVPSPKKQFVVQGIYFRARMMRMINCTAQGHLCYLNKWWYKKMSSLFNVAFYIVYEYLIADFWLGDLLIIGHTKWNMGMIERWEAFSHCVPLPTRHLSALMVILWSLGQCSTMTLIVTDRLLHPIDIKHTNNYLQRFSSFGLQGDQNDCQK